MKFWKVKYAILLACLSSLNLAAQRGVLSEMVCQTNQRVGIKTSVLKQYQKILGYVVWMNPEKVKTAYLIDKGSYRTVHARFEDWKKETAILVSTSGNYVNKNYYQSIGLTVDKGGAMNKVLAKDMDGLVITLNGSLTILNIQKPFELPGIYGKINPYRDKSKCPVVRL